MKSLKKDLKDIQGDNSSVGYIKKNSKLMIIISIFVSIITIVIFSCIVRYVYSGIRMKECLNNNAALYSFAEGNLSLIDNDSGTKIYSDGAHTVRMYDDEIRIVSDSTAMYTKIFQNNILQSIRVYNPLNDLFSYLSPKFWVTGSRTVRSEDIHYIRTEDEIKSLSNSINLHGEDYLLSARLDYMIYKNLYIVTK